jgi:dolichyl-phosphate beta-glucosyltransferase
MFREAGRIGATLRDVLATMRAWDVPFEVIPVDDGSTDDTLAVVRAIVDELDARGEVRPVAYQPNRGKGSAVREGLRAARGSWVLMMDADNSARVREITKLASAASGSGLALVIASRATPDAIVEADPRRKAAGLVFRTMLGLMGLGFVRDSQCGFKLYRRDAARLCADRGEEDGFAFDLEHIGLCRRAGLGVEEVGIRWEHRDGGSVRVVRDGLRMLAQAWRIRRRLRTRIRPEPSPAPRDEGLAGVLLELKPLLAPAPPEPEMVGAGSGAES